MPGTQPACSLYYPAVHSHMMGKHGLLTHSRNREFLGWPLHWFGTPISTLRCLKFLSSVLFQTSLRSIIPQPSMNPFAGDIICAITKPPTTSEMPPPPQEVPTVAHHCCLLSSLVSSITGLQACIFEQCSSHPISQSILLEYQVLKTTVLSKMIFL